MGIHRIIEEKLRAALDPVYLEVVNESSMHNVPPGSETHFKVIVVSERFADCSLLERQRLVYQLLGDELRSGLHALTMKALTPAQWEQAGGQVELRSPLCRGGSKADAS
ncbi:MAG: BolA family protein [Myxococcales bacterium]|nr:BolA family transcriptional regulator [Myxococcota bacterium]MDW8281162.1 BolA family protein [Myxococcales bacterium]